MTDRVQAVFEEVGQWQRQRNGKALREWAEQSALDEALADFEAIGEMELMADELDA